MNEIDPIDIEEVSLFDLLAILAKHWNVLLVSMVIGMLVGIGGWWLKGYEAELKAKPVAALDFVEWQRVIAGLPGLAVSRADAPDIEPARRAIYQSFSKAVMWEKDVVPQFRYSKKDIKSLVGLPNNGSLEDATLIESVLFRAKSRDRSVASGMIRERESFVREGGLVLALKTLVERMDLQARKTETEMLTKISKGEYELAYLRKRTIALEDLSKAHPDKSVTALQSVLDPKEQSAHFLPLTTQIVAIKTQILALEESLSRARDRLDEIPVQRAFVEKALPLIRLATNGFDLAERLSAIVTDIRLKLDPADMPQQVVIDQIANDLIQSHEHFKSFFEENGSVSTRRPKALLLWAMLGIIGGGLTGVIAVFLLDAARRRQHQRRVA